ncbi:MAG: homoserine kinase [Pseudomonadota bacterium]
MAVYTEVSDDALSDFLAAYDVGALLSFKGIAEGVENTNYFVQTSKAPFILTLYERRVDPDDLPFFLGLMDHLARAGLACATPVATRDGVLLGRLADRPAVLVTFLEGVWPRKPKVAQCEAVGAALAKLHQAGSDFRLTRANALGVADWRPLYDRFAPHADRIAPGLAATIEEHLLTLERAWPTTLPRGVIHADLFPDNVFFRGDDVTGLIDFYFACNDALAYDVAVCLNAWCFEADHAFNITKGQALLRGYTSVRALEPQECEALPLLARGAALRFLLTRAYDWLNTPEDALVKPHDPLAYLRRLRFHAAIDDASAYGLEVGGDSVAVRQEGVSA